MLARQRTRCYLARVSIRPILQLSVRMAFETAKCCRLYGLAIQFVPLIHYSRAEHVFPDIQACFIYLFI